MVRSLAVALSCATLATAGCVTTGTYQKKEAEAAQYKADWETELAKAREIRAQFAALRGEMDGMQVEARTLQEKIKSDEANLVAKQGELNRLREENARQQALVDELSKSWPQVGARMLSLTSANEHRPSMPSVRSISPLRSSRSLRQLLRRVGERNSCATCSSAKH